ncbi:MAG TPA: spore coat protein U domain-containing protein, partial [Ramlibacter sp.]|nr:spore coat protein U domain-containing protein [Ramlibacter sp.]
MSNHRALLKALPAAILVCASGFAAAADTQNLTVSATVSGVCKFSSAAQTLSFGTVDPSAAGPIPGSGAAVKYKCTKDTAATGVTAGNGLNFSGGSRRMGNGTDFIAYTLTISGGTQTGTGFGTGQDKDLTVGGSIVATDYQNASAGAYTDTVVLTLA